MLPKRVSISESEGCWNVIGYRRGGWGETGYSCLVPFAKLHWPMLPWTSFARNVTTRMIQHLQSLCLTLSLSPLFLYDK